MANLKTKTGERVLPEEVTSEYEFIIYLRHLFAYETARRMIAPGSTVLDLGCGEGYGTCYLAPTTSQIHGIDVIAEAVAHAQGKYSSANCSFQPYDGGRIPFPDATFDAIVSFQVIEHVADDRRYAAEIFRVLKSPGVAFITTPNRSYRLKPGQKPWNRFHLREYLASDLAAVLGASFGDVVVQGIRAVEAIQTMEMTRCRQNRRIAELDPLGLRHLLPEAVVPAIIKLLRKVIYRDPGDTASQDFREKYRLDDFSLTDRADDGLDLLALCRK